MVQHGRRDREAKSLGGLEVDHQLELGRLLDGQVSGLGAFQDFVDESRHLLVGRRPSPGGYVAGTGATDGGTAAGGR